MKIKISLFAALLTLSASAAFAQAVTPAPAPTGWKSSAAAGLTLTRGNSETLLATLGANTEKKWDQNEVFLGVDGTYGKSKIAGVNQTTAGSAHGFAQYNRLFNERLYGYARLDGLHDAVASINYRATVSPGLGYYLIKNKRTDLSIEGGPSFVFQKLGGVTDSYVALRVAEKFHHELNDRARIWQTAEWLAQVDKFKNYILNFEIGVEADLTQDKKLSLRTYFQDTYNNVPAVGLKRNDAKLVAAIAYKF